MNALLKPHTKKWFAAFAKWNPWQAALTFNIVKSARSAAVCSYCGVKRVRDYLVVNTRLENERSALFRLCEDCALSRQKNFGEKTVPLMA
ncbi:MAG: hypothetical protein ABSG59_16520 [Verrucomicrobiota bacterium]|jgi:hypothetical protein